MSGIPLRPDEAERKQEVESEMQRRGRVKLARKCSPLNLHEEQFE